MLYYFENEYSREKKNKMSNLSVVYTYTQLASTDFIVTICERSIWHIPEISEDDPVSVERNFQILRNSGKPGETNIVGGG